MAQDALQEASAGAAEAVGLDDFSALLQKEFRPANEQRASRIDAAVKTLAQQALVDSKMIGDDVFTSIDAMKAALDAKLSEQVNQIIHNAEFQKLESAWRGLWYLVINTPTGKDLKIRVMNMSKDETRPMLAPFRDAACG